MNSLKLTYHAIALAGAGASLFFTTPVLAQQPGISPTRIHPTIEQSPSGSISLPQQIAQQFIPAISCPNMVRYVFAETRNFLVYICGRNCRPLMYVAVDKNGRIGGIILPLRSYNGSQFVAANGNVHYILTAQELIVIEGRRIILRERI
ncbi:hypothetical protein [Microseira wollei]|uniref:Uncharacterized protein n=1 Tax=Microseira wollei NIES-4236 TaxID=2530354 RepID=A0AAV3XAS1_9CYAN|nr:hypothetical protein [Microseira wollei]GET39962.1 hypothetical protein MiSe_47350 [Microseira wollei NIES-4236]